MHQALSLVLLFILHRFQEKDAILSLCKSRNRLREIKQLFQSQKSKFIFLNNL